MPSLGSMFDTEAEIEDDKESDLLEAVVEGIGALRKSVDSVAGAIIRTEAAELKHEKEEKEPVINITVPEQKPAVVNVSVPEAKRHSGMEVEVLERDMNNLIKRLRVNFV